MMNDETRCPAEQRAASGTDKNSDERHRAVTIAHLASSVSIIHQYVLVLVSGRLLKYFGFHSFHYCVTVASRTRMNVIDMR
jgi:hypothetical protein